MKKKFIPRPSKGILYRICKDCREEYTGKTKRCKKCRKIAQSISRRKYYVKFRDKDLAASRAWAKANPEKNRAKAKAYNNRKRFRFHLKRLNQQTPEKAAAIQALREKNS